MPAVPSLESRRKEDHKFKVVCYTVHLRLRERGGELPTVLSSSLKDALPWDTRFTKVAMRTGQFRPYKEFYGPD